MLLAAAQTKPVDNDFAANLQTHLRLCEDAAGKGVQLILFPEMSLTGYLLETAAQMAITPDDARLAPLQALAVKHQLTIIAGAPVRTGNQLHIGSFIFQPDGQTALYTKQFLHGDEVNYFTGSSSYNPMLHIGNERVASAICADLTHPEHPEAAHRKLATLYAAGIFYTPSGIAEAYEQLSGYAKTYRMHVLMANYSGPSCNFEAAGTSAFWNTDGKLVAALDKDSEGLLVVES